MQIHEMAQRRPRVCGSKISIADRSEIASDPEIVRNLLLPPLRGIRCRSAHFARESHHSVRVRGENSGVCDDTLAQAEALIADSGTATWSE